MDFLRFALLGLGTGSLYALAALGIVLVFRASGVLNFASGVTGGFAAFVFYDLRDTHHVNWIAALVLSIAFGAALGGATHLLVMVPLRRASALVKLIATLGVLLFLEGVVVLVWGSAQELVKSILPTKAVHVTGSLVIGKDRIVLIGLLIVLAAVLWLIYSRTRFGLATTAVAENRRTAAASGWSTSMIELVNWSVGGALYATAAIFLAPITGLSAGALTLLVVPALAAALVGGFSSFLLTIGGAMLLGVVQAEVGRYLADVTGLADSVPFLLIIVILTLGGRARPARGDLPVRLPLPGPGRVNLPLLIPAIAAGALLVWTVPTDWVDSLATTFIAAVLVLSVVVVTGYAGQLSLSQWALAGFGAWVAARLVAASGWPFWLAALVGVLAAIPAGLIVALPALRTRGVNLAVATLGLALVIQNMILGNGELTGGLDGTNVGTPSLFGVDLDPITYPRRYATLVLIMLVLLGLLVANVRRGRTGRRLLAIRSNERAAASIGIGVYGAKLYAFGLAAAIGAIGGILTGFRSPTVVFTQFDVFGSINVVMYAVIGGIGWASGSLAGATMIAGGVTAKIVDSLGDISGWLPLIAGGGVILTLFQAPDGIAKLNSDGYQALVARLRGGGSAPAPAVDGAAPAGTTATGASDEADAADGAGGAAADSPAASRRREPAVLEVRNLSVRFGGVQALSDVNLRVEPGKVLGLIGPNGAGKTTLLDIVTGFTKPTSGEVLLDGKPIAGWSPVRRARAGLARSFQAVELFPDMTVRENLLAAADTQAPGYYFTDMIRPGRQRPSVTMEEIIEEFGLTDLLDSKPAELPHGRARLVGVARALLADPNVLFLDEPAAGLDSHESAEIGTVIRGIAERRNTAVLLIEHDIPLVLGICDRIAVLDFGRKIAEGAPEEIRTNPDVIRAYLGEDSDTAGSTAEPAGELTAEPT
ncbi:branched-chain amino acid ABC transporter permease/ATP-binding protein, partial [Frankia sp. Cj3]|uniref:branched-chain amino acid ABC transporter permease/ATP-binding protein n=1 Tax=Frankia sp. Cj3 TaxID=2880976 RepID=UPI001EF730D3